MKGRSIGGVLGIALVAGLLPAATLEQLSLDDMIDRSTEIVRGRVVSTAVIRRGPVLYTTSRIQVTERLKGPNATVVDIAVPGGVQGNLRQVFSGAPSLQTGSEYVVFIWSGPSGVRQVIGFSQGLFDVKKDKAGEAHVVRMAATETMLDARSGLPVRDTGVRMKWQELKQRIVQRLGARHP